MAKKFSGGAADFYHVIGGYAADLVRGVDVDVSGDVAVLGAVVIAGSVGVGDSAEGGDLAVGDEKALHEWIAHLLAAGVLDVQKALHAHLVTGHQAADRQGDVGGAIGGNRAGGDGQTGGDGGCVIDIESGAKGGNGGAAFGDLALILGAAAGIVQGEVGVVDRQVWR